MPRNPPSQGLRLSWWVSRHQPTLHNHGSSQMSVLVNKETRVICQGITGKYGGFHSSQCRAYGTKLVAGETPGKGGQKFEGAVPIFDSVEQAVKATGADATMILVPPAGAADA